MGISSHTILNDFVSNNAPICYGILKPGEHVADGIPVIKVKDISSGQVKTEGLLKTSMEIHAQYKRSELKTGDILLTIRGTTGRVAIVPEILNGANITQDTARIRVSSDDCPKYLFYALQSPKTQQLINLNTVGQAVKGINIAEVKKLIVFHPPLPEQRKIAKILSTWDKAISTTEKLIAASKQQKKALMQQLLTGKKRLINPETGKAFEGEWEEVKLGDVISLGRGFAFKSSQYEANGTKVVRVTNISSSGHIDLSDCVYVPNEITNNYRNYALRNEDILLVMVGATAGKLGFVSENILPSLLNQNMWSLRTRDLNKINQLFLRHIAERIVARYMLTQQGSARGFFTQSTFELVNFHVPSVEEQQKIAAVLTAADNEITQLENQLTSLKQEKKALMQQLLTGKRRVSV